MISKPELVSFLLQHTPHIANTTAPLSRFVSGRLEHYGSCVLLKIGAVRLAVTAAHVADDFGRKKIPTVFPSDSLDDPPVPLEGTLVIDSSVKQGVRDPQDPYDVAVVELKASVADRLSHFMRFLTLDEIEPHYLRLPPADYAVFGYPCDLTDSNEEQRTIVSTVLPYFTSLYEHDRAPVRFDPHVDILMNLQRPYTVGGEEYGFSLPTAYGLSGSGMWRVKDGAAPVESIDWRQMKMIGIVNWWDPSSEVIKGTKIKYVLQMIHGRRPDLQSEIDHHFPYPSLR